MKEIYNIKYFVAGLIAIGWASFVCAIFIYIDNAIVRVYGTVGFLAGIFFLAGITLLKESTNKPGVVV